jgi:hypothetical protein
VAIRGYVYTVQSLNEVICENDASSNKGQIVFKVTTARNWHTLYLDSNT